MVSKIRAWASRHRAISGDQMVRAEGELTAEVAALLTDAERLDAAEDAAYGVDRRGDELPAELTCCEGRLAAIGQAKAALEAEHRTKARTAAELAATEGGQDPEQVTSAGDVAEATAATAVAAAKAQRSFTDPDARIMKTSDSSLCYCCDVQTIVDEPSQVILSSMLRPSGTGCPALPGMLTALKTSLAAAGIGGLPTTLLADAGYFLADNVTALTAAGMDPLLATGRLTRGQKPAAAPRGRIPNNLTLKQPMTRKLQSVKGKADYARRKAIVDVGLRADESRPARRTVPVTRHRQDRR